MFLVVVSHTNCKKKSELKSSIDIVSRILTADSLLSIHVETIESVILWYNALLQTAVNRFF